MPGVALPAREIGGGDDQRHWPAPQEGVPPGQLIQEGKPPVHLPRVHPAKRVIHQQHFRLQRQGAGQAGAFPPTVAHRAREAVGPGLQLQARQQFGRRRGGLGMAQVAVVAQRERDILREGEVVEQLAAVEHEAQAQAGWQAGVLEDGHGFSEEAVLALLRRHHAPGQPEEIALARAVQSRDDPVIAGAHGPVDVLGDPDRGVMQRADGHVDHLESRHFIRGGERRRHVAR